MLTKEEIIALDGRVFVWNPSCADSTLQRAREEIYFLKRMAEDINEKWIDLDIDEDFLQEKQPTSIFTKNTENVWAVSFEWLYDHNPLDKYQKSSGATDKAIEEDLKVAITEGFKSLSESKQPEGGFILPETKTSTPIPEVKPCEDKEAWSASHYDFNYQLTEDDIARGSIKLDPMFVSHQWQLGKKDPSCIIYHQVKTCARFGEKNTIERECLALYKQAKRLCELNGVDVD